MEGTGKESSPFPKRGKKKKSRAGDTVKSLGGCLLETKGDTGTDVGIRGDSADTLERARLKRLKRRKRERVDSAAADVACAAGGVVPCTADDAFACDAGGVVPCTADDAVAGHSPSAAEPVTAVKDASMIRPTLSVAVPGSVVANAQGRELRTDSQVQASALALASHTEWDACTFLARLLQYLETPQYLRKQLFPVVSDLRYAGVLNPLDTPHHMRLNEARRFRSAAASCVGVRVRQRIVFVRQLKALGLCTWLTKLARDGAVVGAAEGGRSLVNVGLPKDAHLRIFVAQDVIVDRALQPGVRVTCELSPRQRKAGGGAAQLVSRSAPVRSGLYWGYRVRMANGLSTVLSDSPYEGGYDLIIGTSERGSPVAEFRPPVNASHVLVIFGGPAGLEAALSADPDARAVNPAALCHAYVNTCPDQGSRTIRTEEAVLISLAALQPTLRMLAGRG